MPIHSNDNEFIGWFKKLFSKREPIAIEILTFGPFTINLGPITEEDRARWAAREAEEKRLLAEAKAKKWYVRLWKWLTT
jgi:hypothetical protein